MPNDIYYWISLKIEERRIRIKILFNFARGGFVLKFCLTLQVEKTFVVVWIVLMQPLLSKTTMKGKISKN